jgi:hypothetical protein
MSQSTLSITTAIVSSDPEKKMEQICGFEARFWLSSALMNVVPTRKSTLPAQQVDAANVAEGYVA